MARSAARAHIVLTATHRRRPADSASLPICSFSPANDFTTRTPLMFSSTIVAISAVRAIVSHDRGNIHLRIVTPMRYTNGMVTRASRVSSTLICSM